MQSTVGETARVRAGPIAFENEVPHSLKQLSGCSVETDKDGRVGTWIPFKEGVLKRELIHRA